MVFSFFGGGKGPGSARQPEFAELRAYWEALRVDGALPTRASINPRGIAGILDKAVLIERVAPGVARLRIAGMTIRDLADCEVIGMPLSALFEPAARERLAAGLEAMFSSACALDMSVTAERGLARPVVTGRMLLLPVTGSAGARDMAIGCLVMAGPLGRVPRRLGLARVLREPITLPGAPARPAASRVVELAEPPAAFRPAPKGHPHLRLVKSAATTVNANGGPEGPPLG